MEEKLYYTAPSDKSFEDMKKAAIAVWNTMGNDGGYRDEKIARIKDIKNVQDNFMYMFAMFDMHNQRKCAALLDSDTVEDLRERLIDGNNGDQEYADNLLGV